MQRTKRDATKQKIIEEARKIEQQVKQRQQAETTELAAIVKDFDEELFGNGSDDSLERHHLLQTVVWLVWRKVPNSSLIVGN
jgi:predicted outer membrane protein